MRVRGESLHPREEQRPRARGTGGPTAKTPEPLARSFSRAVYAKGEAWGGRHGGSARSCLCADPCPHSVQDLNRLTCFRNFWNRGIWQLFFLVANECQVFSMLWCWVRYFGVLIVVLLALSTPSCPLDVEMGESHDDWYILDATVTACVFLRRARQTPLSEQQ